MWSAFTEMCVCVCVCVCVCGHDAYKPLGCVVSVCLSVCDRARSWNNRLLRFACLRIYPICPSCLVGIYVAVGLPLSIYHGRDRMLGGDGGDLVVLGFYHAHTHIHTHIYIYIAYLVVVQ
ncbi:hypothetical protein GGS21DRAFT_205239 [Xylaria nigripes]|nr:hypothetical protein GGS21DRAFT_205239 [Xylaria nigripes]